MQTLARRMRIPFVQVAVPVHGPSRRVFALVAFVILLALACRPSAWPHRFAAASSARRQALGAVPSRVLWVWERPEDLRVIGPRAAGVAVLAETLRLGSAVRLTPRRQPVVLPTGAVRIAVVRIEVEADFAAHREDPELLAAAVEPLVALARQPGIAALQIDFDARQSERGFYRRLLEQLRARMPAGLPLTMTALASWCSSDDWIADLPIDEATPMFFRMEPDRRRVLATEPEYRIREPLCQGSVGVSVSEPWPKDIAGKRVYIFADHGWARDFATLNPQPATGKERTR